MIKLKDDPGLYRSLAIYKALLSFYPKAYQVKYKDQMLIVFKDLYREQKNSKGKVGIQFWFEILVDFLKTVMQQHFKLGKQFSQRSLRFVFITIITFLVSYLTVSSVFWFFFNKDKFEKKTRLANFVTTYDKELKIHIFDTIFNKAALCVRIKDEEVLQKCEKQVGRMIGDSLHEEELAYNERYEWPVDLFFVKQQHGTFYLLRWNGELTNISHTVNRQVIANKQSYFSVFLDILQRRNCRHFNVWANSNSCEIYEIVQLSNNNSGYVVRLIAHETENDIIFVFLIPFLAFNLLFDPYTWRDWRFVLYFGVFFLFEVVFPLIASAVVLVFYRKRRKKKQIDCESSF